jgi:hypothetical protein
MNDYTLSNLEINNLMDGIKNFRGVFMKDELPKIMGSDESIIINLDSSKNDGTHWVCAYNDKFSKYVYYFDSYGVLPPINVVKYLNTSGKTILYNTSQLQSLISSMCGYYCVFICKELYKHKSFYDTVYALNRLNKNDNDMFLKKYFRI